MTDKNYSKMKNILLFISVFLTVNMFAAKFYIDPINGSDSGNGTITSPWKTLQNVIEQNSIESKSFVTPYDPNNPQVVIKNPGAPVKSGDTLMLYSGLHGEIDLMNYINNDYLTIMNVEDNSPIFKSLHIQAGRKWVFKGITISSEPYDFYINNKLVYLESHSWQGPVSDIIIQDCHIYSSLTAWENSNDWLTKASDGIIIKGDSIKVVNNQLLNLRFGISMVGDYINISGNTIKNFSGDGIRLLGSNNIIEKNIIKNCYAVDTNHDDGIQSFTTGGIVADNNIIRQNIIINYEDPNQALLGPLQGIGCFDGPFYNWTVENNLIIVNSWHGIAFYGLINGNIVNNTVLDPSPNISPGPAWIKVDDETGFPSSGCTVKNNVSNTIDVTPNTSTGNNATLQTLADYTDNFVNDANNDFHLLETSSLIDMADSNIAPDIDLDGNIRPSGSLPDIGAYEFQYPTLTNRGKIKNFIKIYPNPFTESINITGIDLNMNSITDIKLLDINGRIIKSYNNVDLPTKLNLSFLKNGVYFIQLFNDNEKINNRIQVLKITNKNH